MNKNMKNYILKLSYTAIVVTASILCIIYFENILEFAGSILNILMPFIYGAVMAYILTPLCNRINKKINNDNISIIITMGIALLIISVLCIIVLPQSIDSIIVIIENLPETLVKLQLIIDEFIQNNSWIPKILGDDNNSIKNILNNIIQTGIIPNIESIATNIASGASSILKVIFNLIVGIVACIFMMMSRARFAKHWKIMIHSIFGDKISKIIFDELTIANKMFSGFFFGKIVDSIIIGLICFLGMKILGMPYAMLVSVIVGITNIIPIAGPFIGAVPGFIIIFSESPMYSLYFIIFIVVLQQIDGNIIGPKCIGSSTGLDTFWVLFAIMFFGGLWGIIGMVIGVPLLAVIFDIGTKVFKYLDNKQIERTQKVNDNIRN